MINTSSLFSMIDFAGVFAGAMGGALEAKQNRTYQFDFVGVIGLGFISALGGGITRDILLQHGPPLAFTDLRYLLIALTGGLLGLLCGSNSGQRLGKLLILVDAAALGFFAVAGSTRALAAGFSFLPAMLMGIITAVGGGSLRDVFSGRTPKVFERGDTRINFKIRGTCQNGWNHECAGGVPKKNRLQFRFNVTKLQPYETLPNNRDG
jgi:uncharacterized membrane protein YeiH